MTRYILRSLFPQQQYEIKPNSKKQSALKMNTHSYYITSKILENKETTSAYSTAIFLEHTCNYKFEAYVIIRRNAIFEK